jgi:hypothetical protein
MTTPPDAPVKNKGGRPRKAVTLDQKERNERRKIRLERSGGRTVRAALNAAEATALDLIRARDGHTTDRDAIGSALLRDAKRRVPKG